MHLTPLKSKGDLTWLINGLINVDGAMRSRWNRERSAYA